METRPRLGLDVDGVCADFTGAYGKIAKELLGLDLDMSRQTEWDFDCLGVTKEQDDSIWTHIKGTWNFWQDLPPAPGIDELGWGPKPYDAYFITSRVPTAGEDLTWQTCRWLEHLTWTTYPQVIPVEHASDKPDIIRALKLQAYIDDKPSTCLQVAQLKGVRSYVRDQPYNRIELPGVIRVADVNEFLRRELGE